MSVLRLRNLEQEPSNGKVKTRNWPFYVSESELESTGETGLPFMTDQQKPILNSSKILEAFIVSIFTTLLIFLLAIPRIQEQITTLSSKVEEVKADVREIKRDIYVPVNRKPAGPRD